MSDFHLSNASKMHRTGVDPRLIEISDLAITLTLVDFGHGPDSGVRSAERQAQLFAEGKSQKDGTRRRSCHQDRKALDFYAYVDGRASWHPPHLAAVACAFLQAASVLGYRVAWGGLWESRKPKIVDGIPYGWDCPHIELLD